MKASSKLWKPVKDPWKPAGIAQAVNKAWVTIRDRRRNSTISARELFERCLPEKNTNEANVFPLIPTKVYICTYRHASFYCTLLYGAS